MVDSRLHERTHKTTKAINSHQPQLWCFTQRTVVMMVMTTINRVKTVPVNTRMVVKSNGTKFLVKITKM